MIYKRCPRCGARIPSGTKCPKCKTHESGRKKSDGVRKEYKTYKWQQLRDYCLKRYNYMDLYALYHDGKIVAADRVHHIVEALDAPERFYDTTNHFPCSDASHHMIHYRYKTEGAAAVQDELRRYIDQWRKSSGMA